MTSGRVLFITPNSPLPMASGDTIRNFNLMRELVRRGWELSLFSLASGLEPTSEHRQTLDDLCDTVVIEPRRIAPMTRIGRTLRDVATGTAFQRNYFWVPEASARLQRWLQSESFDVIVLSQLYMYRFLPPKLRARAVLDSQNAEASRVASMATGYGLTPRSVVARLQKNAVRQFEERAVQSVARTVAVSVDERDYFDRLAPGRARLVPNGVDLERYQPRAEAPKERRILYMGSMSYSANVDAVLHLINDILPRLPTKGAKLTLLGSSPPPAVYTAARASCIPAEVTGYVESTQPYVEASSLLAVPLRSGGGTRLKILEALAQGLPVITSSIGCEGLGLTHQRDVIIADDPAEFARWIDRLLDDAEICERLSREGRNTVEQYYSWTSIGEALDKVLQEVWDEAA